MRTTNKDGSGLAGCSSDRSASQESHIRQYRWLLQPEAFRAHQPKRQKTGAFVTWLLQPVAFLAHQPKPPKDQSVCHLAGGNRRPKAGRGQTVSRLPHVVLFAILAIVAGANSYRSPRQVARGVRRDLAESACLYDDPRYPAATRPRLSRGGVPPPRRRLAQRG